MKRRKNKVLDLAYRQMAVSLDTVNDIEKALKAMYVGDKETAETAIERLFGIEEETDNLRRMVFEELTKGNMPPPEREDIMHLVKRLDEMADHVKDSARDILVLLNTEIPTELWKAFHEMSLGLVKTAAVLGESLRNLSENPSKARALSERVEEEENQVDEKHLAIKSLLLRYGAEMNPAALMILKSLLDSIETAADDCADTGDYIRILTVPFK